MHEAHARDPPGTNSVWPTGVGRAGTANTPHRLTWRPRQSLGAATKSSAGRWAWNRWLWLRAAGRHGVANSRTPCDRRHR